MEQASHLHNVSMSNIVSKKEVYDEWSNTYDSYVQQQEYTGPQELVNKLATMIMNFNIKPISILDFGCGTGLVGEEIKNNNLPVKLDGVDLSPLMLEKASEKNCYDNLYEKNLLEENILEISKNNNLDKIKKYSVIVSCGVFLEGHAPLEVINNLLDHLQIEGFLLFTIRDSYLESEKEKFREIITDNIRVKVLESQEIKYLKDVRCRMFLLYRVC